MTKAKMYKGTKIQILDLESGYEDYGVININTSIEEFHSLNKDYNPMLNYTNVDNIKVVATDLDLYEVVICRPDGDINLLINFRKLLNGPNRYKNSILLTKEEIDYKIKSGYIIYVRGIGEIESINEI